MSVRVRVSFEVHIVTAANTSKKCVVCIQRWLRDNEPYPHFIHKIKRSFLVYTSVLNTAVWDYSA